MTKLVLFGLCFMYIGVAGCRSTSANNRQPDIAPSNVITNEQQSIVNANQLNRIPGTFAIAIPREITGSKALDCIEDAIHDVRQHRASYWKVEDRDPENNWILISMEHRTHYFQVCYRIVNRELVPDVPLSRNLNQNGSSIHKKVPRWINNLRPLIQAKFYDAMPKAIDRK